jgi:hypothetical protein
MHKIILGSKRLAVAALMAITLVASIHYAFGQTASSTASSANINFPMSFGPYNGHFLADGKGLTKSLAAQENIFKSGSSWTIYCWVRGGELQHSSNLLAGLGDPEDEYSRYLGVIDGKFIFWGGHGSVLTGNVSPRPAIWHLLAATFDGAITRLYVDGAEVANGKLPFGAVTPELEMAPEVLPWQDGHHFGGNIADLTIEARAMSAASLKRLFTNPVDFSLINFEEGSKDWPVQTVGQAGYRAPQDPSTMPRSNAPFSPPVVHVEPIKGAGLFQNAVNDWTLASGWKLVADPRVHATAEQLSRTGFNTADWLSATVPGTVLTTMIDRGVYADPDYGLNNLAIPESLNRQNYWYRVEFTAPHFSASEHVTLTFNGINYAAVVWLNGERLGNIRGAFIRGTFDVTGILKSGGANALAVRISPPPHPGIPNEQSLKGGPGENGGILCLDGPTFVATEGWDWIPGIRDRNSGIWQDVRLHATSQVQLGDPKVVTTLPLPDTSRADVIIRVPIENQSSSTVNLTLSAAFGIVAVTKHFVAPAGMSTVTLTPNEFPQLRVQHPHLWWPNGYGKPNLYNLSLKLKTNDAVSDQKQLRFGIREITYELSLLNSSGHLQRVLYSPSARLNDEKIVDVSHEGILEIPNGWAPSLSPGAESSPSIHNLEDSGLSPYLVVRVNGVRIAVRGGSWGMDDSRKRVTRERMEPYFRLQRDANLNTIRNWVGQNTEETFYQLADEYGMLVWNDFWESTQDDNVEAEDPALFLANAKDTILRFRNHPSIMLWCGRNEGVPQPIINLGLDELVRTLDGTRYYSPSSNRINLQDSGPYKYQNPADYYTTLNRGFAVETGTQSMPTLESFRSFMPKADQWPISDDWAYHDWHQSDNGDTTPFMNELAVEFGAATGLEDFERKAQMLNYVDHRAIFEGFNAHLWTANSGRMLWMTHPSWPSTMWQIYSSDYDTQASFYGVKKACEPVHIQLDLSNGNVDVVNTTTDGLASLSASARVFSIDSKPLFFKEQQIAANADSVTNAFHVSLPTPGLRFVELELKDNTGKILSRNFYWLGSTSQSYRVLNTLPEVRLTQSAVSRKEGDEVHVRVTLQNISSSMALAAKLTLQNAKDSSRILPAYFSDNYVSLLPGETREIAIDYPAKAAVSVPKIVVRGWNVVPSSIAVSASPSGGGN